MSDRAILVPDDATRLQGEASAPERSVWVRANAGAGKTHVLAQRVVKLLLEGVEPSKILCLTYTKAAAANMQSRVFDWLGAWTVLDDEALKATLRAFGATDFTPDSLRKARRLFARALEAPGGLKIQTIHAFCETILRRFPLEANIAGHFENMDEALQAALLLEARRHILSQTYEEQDLEFRTSFDAVMALAGEAGLEKLLSGVIAKRLAIQSFIDKVAMDAQGPDSYQKLFAAYGFTEADTKQSLAATAWPVPSFDKSYMASLYHVVQEQGGTFANDTFFPYWEAAKAAQNPVERLELLKRAMLTQKLTPVSKVNGKRFKKSVITQMPDADERFEEAAALIIEIDQKIQNFAALKATRHAMIVASRLLRHYERLKRARGCLDFDDIIARTARLLHRKDVGPWVQYKLDQGIDHVLIDEAQDTSPTQWNVIEDLVGDFFSGNQGNNRRRTLFVVGDEKQSIYSFQGARPDVFAQMQSHFSKAAKDIGEILHETRLNFSFRSTADILAGVDAVFAGAAAAKGLSQTGAPDTHASLRHEESGAIDLWPREIKQAEDEEEDWRKPVDHASAPAVKVAGRIAGTIAAWLESGARLDRKDRPIRPGDILVLVRKRDTFIHALARDLKRLAVPVAGTDRLKLTTHIGIQDLLALARFCVQPKDDLSLAIVLKSPLFGWSDDALFDLAYDRESTLVERLKTGERPAWQAIANQLQQWQIMAQWLRPHDFFATILSRDGVRARLIARLGPEIEDILDEFLAYAMAQEGIGLPGLDAFIEALTLTPPDIKREMDQGRDEVRIMTAHAAKGLEAPIVFVVDGGGKAYSHQHEPVFLPVRPKRATWLGDGFIWKGDKSAAHAPLYEAPKEGLKAAAEDEYRRLLYVAMTRAEDRLIMCGYATKEPGEKIEPTWYDYVERGLSDAKEGQLIDMVDEVGQEIRRYQLGAARLFTVAKPDDQKMADKSFEPLLLPLAKRDPSLPKPLAPSGATAMIELGREAQIMTRSPVLGQWRAADLAETAPMPPADGLKRGSALHRLMQSLPEIAPEHRAARADLYLAQALPDWPQAARDGLREEALSVFAEPAFAPYFAEIGGSSQAEVPLMGTLTLGGSPRALSGQIDRLMVTDKHVTIIDFKTDRQVPEGESAVAEAYIIQLALYRALVQKIYPKHEVHAVLIYSFAPKAIILTSTAMQVALEQLDQRLMPNKQPSPSTNL